MRLSYISDALTSLGYTEFVINDDTYEGIRWIIEPGIIPSKEEVLNKVEELKEIDAEIPIKKAAILERLGLTEEEFKILNGGI